MTYSSAGVPSVGGVDMGLQKFGIGKALLACGGFLVVVAGLWGCVSRSEAISVTTKSGDANLNAWLAKPEGNGPFPAVVLLHGCSGTERSTSHQMVWRGLNRHADLLNENGYVTLILDSFGSRGVRDGCKNPLDRLQMRTRDARAALDHLLGLPFVEPGRIGLVGLSSGGHTALWSISDLAGTDMQGSIGFGAVVAFYPYCELPFTRFDVPVLILIGEDDDWTPADLCRRLERRLTAESDLSLVVYPDTYHSFDLPLTSRHLVEGHVVAPNNSARKDAQSKMLDFFHQHLPER